MARTPLEVQHQRLGHIGTDRLLELARGGKLKEGFETYKNDPFKIADCEACLSAKITRYSKSGDAPKLGGGLEVDITGPFSTSMDGLEH